MDQTTDQTTPGKAKKKRTTHASWGYIRKLPSGRLQASYQGPDGKRYNADTTFGANNRTAAKNWLASQQASIAAGTWTRPLTRQERQDSERFAELERQRRTQPLGEFIDLWIAARTTRTGAPIRPNTRDLYARLRRINLAELTDIPLAELSKDMIQTWHDTAKATGHLTTTAAAYRLLRGVLASAVDRGLLQHNPAEIKWASTMASGVKVEPPTRAELDALVEAIEPRYKAMLLISAWGGLRYGEITALRRKDITVHRKGRTVTGVMVTVERQVIHASPENGGTQVTEPKTAGSIRKVWLPQPAWAGVVKHLEDLPGKFPVNLLFPGPSGPDHFMRQGSWARFWKPAKVSAGAPGVRFHSLRHFAGTTAAQNGATLADVMAQLGHTSSKVALGYQHANEARSQELARAMR